ncbi:hypothetical protein ACLKMH_16400 [Psychromonas sp. KJ10-10]|uniref:hypothetical protein n=1 Tax=Psychromonas sp. KJ10-10 TaxID=3391823 RepID=UPI0039B6C74E
MLKAVDILHLKHFLSFVKKYKRTAWLGVAMLPLSVITSLLFPWLIIQVIDVHLVQGNREDLWLHIFYLVVVLVINYFVDAIYAFNLRKTGLNSITDMRASTFCTST